MTVLRERLVTEVTRMPTRRSHVTEWVLGTIGVLAAGVGAWMYYVPADWFLGGLAVGWYYGMFIAAGLLLAAAFGIYAWKSHVDNPEWSVRTVVPIVLALAALAGATMFTVFWMTDQAQIEYSSPERARVVGQAETEYFSPERARIVNGS